MNVQPGALSPDRKSLCGRLTGLIIAGIALVSCGSHGVIPGSSLNGVKPASVSPALVSYPPMAQTQVLPASSMRSPALRTADLAAPTYALIPGSASQVFASPDGTLWALAMTPAGPDKYIWHYVNGSWTNIPGLASRLAPSVGGTLWAINSAGGIYSYTNGSWSGIAGGASDIATTSNQRPYVLSNSGPGPDRGIWEDDGNWVQVVGSASALVSSFDAGTYPNASRAGASFYALNASGGIYVSTLVGFNGFGYNALPGAATAVTPTYDGAIFALGKVANPDGSYPIYYYDFKIETWAPFSGSGTSISAGPANLYVVSKSGAIYAASSPQSSSGFPLSATASSNSAFSIANDNVVPIDLYLRASGCFSPQGIAPASNLSGWCTSAGWAYKSTLNRGQVVNFSCGPACPYIEARAVGAGNPAPETGLGQVCRRGATAPGGTPLPPDFPSSGLYPCDLQNAYGLSYLSSGAGQTVAIVDAYDDPTAESDLSQYRGQFGLPDCSTANGCFRKVGQTGGGVPAPDPGWSQEIALDTDAVSAACPRCKILLVEANSTSNADFGTAVNTAVSLGATVVSMSFGGPEIAGETTLDSAYYHHPGIPLVVAAGDKSYAGGVTYPAASPYVTAVGGTTLVAGASTRGWTETVWENYSTHGLNQGTNSGCSAFEPKPSWQHDAGCANRMTNDVAADADPYTGIAYYETYGGSGWAVAGGTSLATPIIAAGYALAGNGAAINDGSFPYLHASLFNDVVTGNNLDALGWGANSACSAATTYYCFAGSGYDGPTGIGTPNGQTGAQPLMATRVAGALQGQLEWMGRIRALPSHRVCADALPGHAACMMIAIDGSP